MLLFVINHPYAKKMDDKIPLKLSTYLYSAADSVSDLVVLACSELDGLTGVVSCDLKKSQYLINEFPITILDSPSRAPSPWPRTVSKMPTDFSKYTSLGVISGRR